MFLPNSRSWTITNSICETQSNLALQPHASELKPILCDRKLPFRKMHSHVSPRCADSIENDPIQTMDQTNLSLNRKGPPPSPTSRVQSALAISVPRYGVITAYRRQYSRNSRRGCTLRANKAMITSYEASRKNGFVVNLFNDYTETDVVLKNVDVLFQSPL